MPKGKRWEDMTKAELIAECKAKQARIVHYRILHRRIKEAHDANLRLLRMKIGTVRPTGRPRKTVNYDLFIPNREVAACLARTPKTTTHNSDS